MLAQTARRRPSPSAAARALALSGVALACWLAPTAVSAAAGPHACAPPTAQRSADAARAVRPDGSSEITEFAARGGYRVTRCDKDGSALVSQTVSPIAGPDGTTVLVPTERVERGVTVAMLYGDPADPRWADEFRGARGLIAGQIIPPTVPSATPPAALPLPGASAEPGSAPAGPTPGGARSPGIIDGPGGEDPSGSRDRPARPGAPGSGSQVAVAAVAGDACTNSQFATWESAWPTRDYNYYVNRSRFNYNDTSVGSIVDGHRNWDRTYNSCGLNDITNLNSHHLGSTGQTIHTYPDGRSVVDKGSLSSICPGALACAWLFTNASGHTTETDQRYNENVTFSNVGAAGAYDYESISAHETGHSIGLDHANSSSALTMYFQTATGATHARSLAKGDVLGLRARYP